MRTHSSASTKSPNSTSAWRTLSRKRTSKKKKKKFSTSNDLLRAESRNFLAERQVPPAQKARPIAKSTIEARTDLLDLTRLSVESLILPVAGLTHMTFR